MTANLPAEILPRAGLAALLVTASLFSLSACQLERFRHEKYNCQSSYLDISEIIIRYAETGRSAKISSSSSDREGIITQISDSSVTISADDLILHIDRKSGSLRAKVNNRYVRTSCSVSVFTL